MNAPATPIALAGTPSLALRLFALLAPGTVEAGAAPEAQWLAAQANAMPGLTLDQAVADWRQSPPPEDVRLHALATRMELEGADILAVALALAADTDLLAGRALAWLQAPLGDVHPTLGLVACLEAQGGRQTAETLAALLDGQALVSGLLRLDFPDRALPDMGLRLPRPLLAALAGGAGHWPGVSFADGRLPLLAASIRDQATRHGQILAGAPGRVLVVRSGHPLEARAACAAIAHAAGRRAVFLEAEPPAGLGPWLLLHDALPVLCAELAPGERRELPPLPGHAGPMLVASGVEGAWERAGEMLPAWRVPVPVAEERAGLWQTQNFDPDTARQLGRDHRHASARIAHLAASALALWAEAGDTDAPQARYVALAARGEGGGALGSLAELLAEDIPDAALILPPALERELTALAARCRARDDLAAGLGPAARARYRPGVRALLVGASGTGKTLACGWLATRLGMPLYRVDLAAVSSKYIGETEKNLGELFARAEHAEVILLFDEADALFAKRTEVKDANDRFANQQTNYLLQRLESYDGIVLLTSNSRARFDAAFTRRLDAILDFPLPGPEERRALWLAHLGDAHALAAADLNRLAAACELAGGHIRNVVLAARALTDKAPITWQPLLRALAGEYRKLGKQPPATLSVGAGG